MTAILVCLHILWAKNFGGAWGTAGHSFVMSGASAGKTSAEDDENGHGIESSVGLIIHV